MLIKNYQNVCLCRGIADLVIQIFNDKTLPLLRVKRPTRNNKSNASMIVSFIAKARDLEQALNYVVSESVDEQGQPKSFSDVMGKYAPNGVKYYHGINASLLQELNGGYPHFYDKYESDDELDAFLSQYKFKYENPNATFASKEESKQASDDFNPENFAEDNEVPPVPFDNSAKQESMKEESIPQTKTEVQPKDLEVVKEEIKKIVLKELESYRLVMNDDVKGQLEKVLEGKTNEIVARLANIQKTEKIIVQKGEEKKLPKELYHRQFNQLLNLIANKFNIYLYGEAGDGKSHLVKQCAESLGLNFYTQTPSDVIGLLGYNDIQGEFQETPFTLWVQNGGLLYLSEFDNVGDAVLSINTALANGFITINKKKYDLHKDCVFVADGNTKGNGATSTYCGRNAIDGATLDRFLFIELNHDNELELALSGDNKEWIAFINSFRSVRDKKKIRCLATMRSTIMMTKLESLKYPLPSAIQNCLLKGLEGEPLRTLANELIVELPSNKYAKALSEVAR